MRRTLRLVGLIAALVLLIASTTIVAARVPNMLPKVSPQALLGTTFTYQGFLKDAGNPATGEYDFQFKLFDAESAGNQVGNTVPKENWPVSSGLFTVPLDFGSGAFNGDARWLETGVRPGASPGAYETLTPRPALTAAPYALFAPRAGSAPWSGLTGVPPGFVDGVDNELSLPFSGSSDAVQPAFEVTVTGYGFGGLFRIDNVSNGNAALRGDTNGSGVGVFGYSTGTNRAGYFWINNSANSNPALHAQTNGNAEAVLANTTGSGWAGRFFGDGASSRGVYISTSPGQPALQVVGGDKNAVVATSSGARALYTEESTQVWFTDYGFGRLRGGRVTISIDPLFTETVTLEEPYHVFTQVYGNAEIYVSQRNSTYFEVRVREGDPNVEFSYRLVAIRRGYEHKRLERAPWADNDPNLYPEKRAEWEAQHPSMSTGPGPGRGGTVPQASPQESKEPTALHQAGETRGDKLTLSWINGASPWALMAGLLAVGLVLGVRFRPRARQ